MRLLIVMLVFTFGSCFSYSQEKLKIYLDCNQGWQCDQDFLRNELTMIDFVRDRFLCDVQIISIVQFTSNGGESNNLMIIGQKEFTGKSDTITYFNDVTATEDIKRNKMLKNIQLGLIPFLLKRGQTDGVEVKFLQAEQNANNTKNQKDPYNLWQFTISASGFISGDRNYASSDISNNISGGRETTSSRISFDLSNNISRSKFVIYNDQGELLEQIKVTNDRQNAFFRYTKKMSEHIGLSLQTNFQRSVFDNFDSRIEIHPQIEYSILPYKDFNTQRLLLVYGLGVRNFNYRDTTIYLKTKETLFRQTLDAVSSFTKPWGSINFGAYWSNYLDDWSKNNFSIGGSINWNVFKGFSLSVGGSYDLIHDQISLPKAGASRDDLLTKRRIIATSYEFFTYIGFSYTFGSIYNSQVHPTFRG